VSEANTPPGTKPLEIFTKDMKALFFVKDLAGNPTHVKTNEFNLSQPVAGRKIKVVFKDGEVLAGTTTGYQPGRPGFLLSRRIAVPTTNAAMSLRRPRKRSAFSEGNDER